jgi:hypothetical protein
MPFSGGAARFPACVFTRWQLYWLPRLRVNETAFSRFANPPRPSAGSLVEPPLTGVVSAQQVVHHKRVAIARTPRFLRLVDVVAFPDVLDAFVVIDFTRCKR